MCTIRYFYPGALSGEHWSLAYLKVNPRVPQRLSTMATGFAQVWELAPHPRLKSIPFPTYCSLLLNLTMHLENKGRQRKAKKRTRPDHCAFSCARKLMHSACLGFTSLNFQVGANAFGLSHLIYWLISQACQLIAYRTRLVFPLFIRETTGKAGITTNLLA